MLLIIEESLKETDKITQDINDLEDRLRKSCKEVELFEQKMEDLKSKINSYENKTKEIKIKKLQRDSKDYLQNQV